MPRGRLLIPLSILAAAFSLPAEAQRTEDNPAVRQLIDQLGGNRRGIRMPTEPAPAAVAPAPAPTTVLVPVPAGAPAAVPKRAEAAASAARPAPPIGTAALTVPFPTGSAAITPAADRALATLGRALASKDLAEYRFRIEGHTDTVGSAESNRTLSERRADAVRTVMERRFGIAAGRLETVGLGESQPLVATPDETPDGRNRRVQIVNLGG